jgi:integrase
VVTAKLASVAQAKLSKQYVKNLTLFCDRILEAWGPKTSISDISTAQCSELLFGQGWSDLSVKYYRTLLNAIFNEGIKRRMCETNPAQFIALPKVAPGAVSVLTPVECLRLLRACDRSILPGVILGMFGGLRPQSEVQRIDWSSIQLGRGFIQVAADRTKTARRRLVTVQHAMRSWLLYWSGGAELPSSGRLWPSEATGRRRLREAREACGWNEESNPWPHDVLRHSFASYHLAKWSDAAKTAGELGHSTTKLLFQHYREVVTPEDTTAFWGLRPLTNPTLLKTS